MPETVPVFGQNIPKTYLYAGGAAVIGIVGYAWWTQGRETEDFLTEEDITSGALDVVGDERLPMDADTPSGPFGIPPATNAEWTQTALERMQALGIGGGDLSAASSAIGKFLARQPLSKVEADLVRQAIAHAGFPPQNGPWVIIEATKPPPSGGGNGNGGSSGQVRLGRPSSAQIRMIPGGRVAISIGPSPTTPSNANVIYQFRFRRQGPKGYYWKGGWQSIHPRGRRTATAKIPNKGRFYVAVRSLAGSTTSQTTNSNPITYRG